MSKKVKQPAKDEFVITEEQKQNDIIIRSICKKTRNLNKKLADIEQLEKRDELKPEQIEKIKNKPAILDQRKRNQDFLKVYKSIVQENAAENKSQLNSDSLKIAQLIVLAQFLNTASEADLPATVTAQELTLIRPLGDINFKDTLAQRAAHVSKSVKIFLEDNTLGSRLEEIFANKDFGARTLPERVTETVTFVEAVQPPKVEICRVEPVVEVCRIDAPVVHAPQLVVEPVAPVTVAEPAAETTPEVASVPQAVAEPVSEVVTPAPAAETPAAEQTPAAPALTQEQPSQNAPVAGEQRPLNGRKYDNQRGGNYRRGPREGGNNGPREAGNNGPREGGYRGNRPRYQERRNDNRAEQQQQQRDSSLSSSEEREYQRREFNKKEIKQLQDDGFIVIPAKQKPKDVNERTDYARKQHGYKEKRNYNNTEKRQEKQE